MSLNEPHAGVPSAPSAMLGIDDVAKLLGVSGRHVRRLVDMGKCPPPVRLGRSCRWPRVTVERWIADGCPPIRRVGKGGGR